VSLETGMAFGVSSLFMCQAHAENGGGRHIAIDPYQEKWWHHIGELNLERAGLREYAELYTERSGAVLPRLMAEGTELDVAFVDGSHRFDSALLDWFFVDRMLRVGGFVILHDLWMPSIRKVICFILRNHGDQYEPVADFMLAPRRGLRRIGKTLSYLRQEPMDVAAAIELAKHRFPNYAVLRKTRHLGDHDYDADWDFYRSF
jgi:predicted O-methyltransferase YrrM